MSDAVDLFVAASQAKTSASELLQVARTSAIDIELLRQENADLKQKLAESLEELSIVTQQRDEATAKTRSSGDDLSSAQQELAQLYEIIQELNSEIAIALGIKKREQPTPQEIETVEAE